MRPHRARSIARLARLATRNAPVRLASMTRVNWSSVMRMSSVSSVMPALATRTSTGTLVRLDLFERPVDRIGVGDIAFDAEQTVGRTRTAVRDGHLVAVGGSRCATARPMPRLPPVTSTDASCGTSRDVDMGTTYLFGLGQPCSGRRRIGGCYRSGQALTAGPAAVARPARRSTSDTEHEPRPAGVAAGDLVADLLFEGVEDLVSSSRLDAVKKLPPDRFAISSQRLVVDRDRHSSDPPPSRSGYRPCRPRCRTRSSRPGCPWTSPRGRR